MTTRLSVGMIWYWKTITAADFSGYTAVVVPEIAQLTDDQYKALFDYANAGGHLLFIGSDLLKYDVLGTTSAGPVPLKGEQLIRLTPTMFSGLA